MVKKEWENDKNKNEKTCFMIKIERDNDGKWGYNKTFDLYISKKKKTLLTRV